MSKYFTCPTVLGGGRPSGASTEVFRTYIINGYASGYFDITMPPPAGQPNGWGNSEGSAPVVRFSAKGDNAAIAANTNGTKAFPVRLTSIKQSSSVPLVMETTTLNNFQGNPSGNGIVFRG